MVAFDNLYQTNMLCYVRRQRCWYWPFSSNSTNTTSTRWSLSCTWATVCATCFSVAVQ